MYRPGARAGTYHAPSRSPSLVVSCTARTRQHGGRRRHAAGGRQIDQTPLKSPGNSTTNSTTATTTDANNTTRRTLPVWSCAAISGHWLLHERCLCCGEVRAEHQPRVGCQGLMLTPAFPSLRLTLRSHLTATLTATWLHGASRSGTWARASPHK
jgi:hypothetical protein